MRVSLIGTLTPVTIVMACLSQSQSQAQVQVQTILLDGIYILITLVLAFVPLRVIDLVEKPETNNRPFGSMALEPFLNTVKGLISLVVLAVFSSSDIQDLIAGGRAVKLGVTVLQTPVSLLV